MFTCKKHFRCNSLQVAPKVLNKYGSPCWTRTNDLRINRASFYINSHFIAFKNITFYLNNIAFSQHFKPLYFTMLRRLCSKIVPKFFHCSCADVQTRHASGLGGWRVFYATSCSVSVCWVSLSASLPAPSAGPGRFPTPCWWPASCLARSSRWPWRAPGWSCPPARPPAP